MTNGKWFWVLAAGIVGGFAFAAGSTLWEKTQSKLGITETTAGAAVVGARTANTPGVY
jgi:hypothetical protein